MGKDYEFIDHTADLGILVFGKDVNQLFVRAANALSEILTDISRVEDVMTKDIMVNGDDLEQLMINWLHEVLYYYEVYSFLFKRFEIVETIDSNPERSSSHPSFSLKALGFGEIFDSRKHIILTEVKAVTHHQIEVIENSGKWRARIIFDL